MPYSRNNLATGATITKAALDRMEDGIQAAAVARTWFVPADEPPAALNLPGITVQSTTDDSTALNAILAAVGTAGGGTVLLPSRSIKLAGTVTVPAGVVLRGTGNTRLDYASLSGNGIAILVLGELEKVSLQGPNGSDASSYPSNTGVGVRVRGVGRTLRDVNIVGFATGLDLSEDNTFGFYAENVSIGNAAVCVDMDQSAAHNGGSQLVENGERMVFHSCVLYNSKTGVLANGSGVDAMFTACSFDYIGQMVVSSDAFLHFAACHIETGYAAGTNNWGSTVRHLMTLAGNPRISISNTRFEVRDTGVYALATPEAGPSNYNSGWIRLDGTNTWYGTLPSEARQFQDRDFFYWGASDTSRQFYSPFLSKWSTVSATFVGMDGTGVPAGHVARPASMDIGQRQVTIARDLIGGATAAQGWIEIRY